MKAYLLLFLVSSLRGSGVLFTRGACLYSALGTAEHAYYWMYASTSSLELWRFDIGLPTPYPRKIRYSVALYWAYPKTKTILVEDKKTKGNGEVKVEPVLGKSLMVYTTICHIIRVSLTELGQIEWSGLLMHVLIKMISGFLHLNWDQIEARFARQSRLPLIVSTFVSFNFLTGF